MLAPRKLLTAIGILCFAFVACAVYLQLTMDLLPCPLCIIQRYAFLATGVICLAGAAVNKPRATLMLAGLTTLGGIFTVGKHLWVLSHPGFKCGIDPVETFLNKLPWVDVWPNVFLANGICELATETLFGLNIPTWAAIAFAIVTASLAFTWRQTKRR